MKQTTGRIEKPYRYVSLLVGSVSLLVVYESLSVPLTDQYSLIYLQ